MKDALMVARSIVNGLPDPAILLDQLQHLIAFNAPYALLVGLRGQSADGVGLKVEPFALLGTDPGADDQRAAECFEKKQVIRLAEMQAKTETGGTYTMQVTFLPVLDPKERAVGVIVQFRDVTDDASLQTRYRQMLTSERATSEALRRELEALKATLGDERP
ncbi:MAG: PAS domain-containing protein [Deltaproteobacteria bacterium]|nr:PAS domain-containing protein [Deltaproteobacteria bacterium]